MKLLHFISLVLSFSIFSGCAGVKFYTDEKMTNETGLKYYQSKPYLLVEKNPAKDVVVKSTIIYLPDLSRPTYVKMLKGMGSVDLKVGFDKGAMNSFGSVVDSKTPETITSIAGLATGLSGAAKTLAERTAILSGDISEEETEEQSGDPEKVRKMEKAMEILKDTNTDLDTLTISSTVDRKKRDSTNVKIDSLLRVLALLDDTKMPEIAKKLRSIVKVIDTLKMEGVEVFNGKVSKISDEITRAANILSPIKKAVSLWELYEIAFDESHKTILKKVIIEDGESKKD